MRRNNSPSFAPLSSPLLKAGAKVWVQHRRQSAKLELLKHKTAREENSRAVTYGLPLFLVFLMQNIQTLQQKFLFQQDLTLA